LQEVGTSISETRITATGIPVKYEIFFRADIGCGFGGKLGNSGEVKSSIHKLILDILHHRHELELPGKYTLRYSMSCSRRLPGNTIDNIGISPGVIIPYPPAEQLFD